MMKVREKQQSIEELREILGDTPLITIQFTYITKNNTRYYTFWCVYKGEIFRLNARIAEVLEVKKIQSKIFGTCLSYGDTCNDTIRALSLLLYKREDGIKTHIYY